MGRRPCNLKGFLIDPIMIAWDAKDFLIFGSLNNCGIYCITDISKN